jgi:hypothetical protein
MLVLAGWLLTEVTLDRRREQRLDGNLEKIINLLPLSAKSEQRSDAVRHFIHSNSRHANDAEFRKLLGHKELVAEGVVAYATGQRPEPIHMLCGARANLMSAVFASLAMKRASLLCSILMVKGFAPTPSWTSKTLGQANGKRRTLNLISIG